MTGTLVHRAHPGDFPHPACVTVPWYVDDSSEPTELGSVRYHDAEDMIRALRKALKAAVSDARQAGRPLKIGTARPAVLVFVDDPMPLLEHSRTREVITTAVRASGLTGIHLAFQLTRTDQARIRELGAWGTEMLELLLRHQAGYPVYGTWWPA